MQSNEIVREAVLPREIDSFRVVITDEIAFLNEFLSHRISDEPVAICETLSEIESWYFRASHLCAVAQQIFVEAKKSKLPLKVDKMTEVDRKVLLDAATSLEAYTVDLLEGLLAAIKIRIEVARSLLSYSREEMKTL